MKPPSCSFDFEPPSHTLQALLEALLLVASTTVATIISVVTQCFSLTSHKPCFPLQWWIMVIKRGPFVIVRAMGTKMHKVDDAVTRNHDQKKCQMCRQALSREVIWQQNWHTWGCVKRRIGKWLPKRTAGMVGSMDERLPKLWRWSKKWRWSIVARKVAWERERAIEKRK